MSINATPEPSSSWFDWLKSIDMFGAPIRIHIHKQTDYRTLFSGFLSLVVIVGVVASALTMIIDALYYANINFLATFAPSTNNILSLNSTNFVMAVQINDVNFSPTNSLYSIDFQHVRSSKSGVTSVESLGTTDCSSQYLKMHTSELSGIDTSKFLCPVGAFYNLEAKERQYIRIAIKKCESNSQSSITCAPQADIDDYFSNVNNIKPVLISLYTTNKVLDMLSSDPDITYLQEIKLRVPGGNLGRHTDMFVYEEIVNVEKSVLNTFKRGIEEENTFTFDERIIDQTVYAADGTFLEINIKKSELEKKYVRSFTKIEEILAFMGGLAKALVILASIIAVPFNRFYYNLAISNEIYEFESRPKHYYQKTMKGNEWRKSSKTFSNLDAFTASKDDPTEEGNLAFNRRLIQNEKVAQYHPFFESLLMRHHRLQYTIGQALKNLCCCKRKNLAIKNDLYMQAEHRLRKDIDIIMILKKLQDVDKLKELLLDDDQLELFNYKKPLRIEYLGHLNVINKIPFITKRKRPSEVGNMKGGSVYQRKSMYLHDRPLDTVEQFKTLFEAYKVVSKDRSCAYNPRLGEMLGPDLLKIFQKLDSDYQADMANITRKSSQLNREALDAVMANVSSGNPSKQIDLDRSNSAEGGHTFGEIPRKDKKGKGKGTMPQEELEENTNQEDDIHINVKDPKFPMKELSMIEKSQREKVSYEHILHDQSYNKNVVLNTNE